MLFVVVCAVGIVIAAPSWVVGAEVVSLTTALVVWTKPSPRPPHVDRRAIAELVARVRQVQTRIDASRGGIS